MLLAFGFSLSGEHGDYQELTIVEPYLRFMNIGMKQALDLNLLYYLQPLGSAT